MTTKIGIIGMSPGNAHPYSWSAIINGFFDGAEIIRVGYPGVTAYLQANKNTLGIDNAQVTHVWAQDVQIAESIAAATGIAHVVPQLEDMIGKVDAVILSRDDPEQHVAMARPFLDAGIPIFIDKPLAITTADMDWFAAQHAMGRFIMSCSSMRYSSEAGAVKMEMAALGALQFATAVGKKDWPKYGVHMLEALFALLDDPRPVAVKHIGKEGKDSVQITFENDFQVMIHMYMDISLTFQLSLFGKDGWRLIEYKNWYAMFRNNIIEFVRSVQQGSSRLAFEKTERIIRTLIAARESLESEGKTIYL
ncbi:Gfo/Idh/MocA family oxidoreductase [Chitinophaga defluvii]|uniref:Gfo/Idh/MocA family oxidoreductase n=1 Tax=Chitinophaga defluvii TaxID=3163343 RepID=A0ABV2SZ28_9BACT